MSYKKPPWIGKLHALNAIKCSVINSAVMTISKKE